MLFPYACAWGTMLACTHGWMALCESSWRTPPAPPAPQRGSHEEERWLLPVQVVSLCPPSLSTPPPLLPLTPPLLLLPPSPSPFQSPRFQRVRIRAPLRSRSCSTASLARPSLRCRSSSNPSSSRRRPHPGGLPRHLGGAAEVALTPGQTRHPQQTRRRRRARQSRRMQGARWSL